MYIDIQPCLGELPQSGLTASQLCPWAEVAARRADGGSTLLYKDTFIYTPLIF